MLAETESGTERLCAAAHLVVVLLIGCIVLVAFALNRHVDRVVGCGVLVDLGIASFGLAWTRYRRAPSWLAWVAGLLDIAVLMGTVLDALRVPARFPDAHQPALIGAWGIFLAFALTAMRGRPGLLLVQTALFAGGMAFAVADPPSAILRIEESPWISTVFAPAENTIRIAVICLAGAMLGLACFRARANLRHAIVVSRRAANLSRYLAPSVASVVADTDTAALREGRQQNAAVLFADIRGFTSLSTTMSPREIAAFLTVFRRLAVDAVAAEGGVIDKFIGDGIMALFGVPIATSRDAGRAIRAAQTLVASVRAWSDERAARGLQPVGIGIGVHYGPVFAGVLGDERLEFTVLGDTVNVAQRLEGLAKSLNHDCVISAWAVRAARADGSGGWSCRGLPAQSIRGHHEPVAIFALTGVDRA